MKICNIWCSEIDSSANWRRKCTFPVYNSYRPSKYSNLILKLPYSGKFLRGNIFVDFMVSTKPQIFSTKFDIIAI